MATTRDPVAAERNGLHGRVVSKDALILNAYSVVAAFAAVLRIALGGAILVVAVRTWRAHRRRVTGDRADDCVEARYHLLVTLSSAMVGLAVVSWPLLYLVLQSYVPEWPGVMCIQGVTRIGAGSLGAAGHLPGLVAFIEVSRPLLLFLAGGWLVLHLARRMAFTGARTGALLAALAVVGLAATADGGAELAYLVIPKQETFHAVGCCVAAPDSVASVAPSVAPVSGGGGPAGRGPLAAGFFVLGAALLVLLSAVVGRVRSGRAAGRLLVPAVLAAAVSVPMGLAFLASVAAPAFLRLPFHECVYCLLTGAPESIVGIVLYVAGAFAVGWAAVAHWLARADSRLLVPLFQVARFGYLAALLMAAVRLALP